MTDDVMSNVVEYIKKRADHCCTDDTIVVIFHGGEPLLTDVQKLSHIVESCQTCENVQFTITTNLIYSITNQILDFFKLMSVNGKCYVSTSWDYKMRFSNGQEQLWCKNVRRLQENSIDVFPIISLSKMLVNEICPAALFYFFQSLNVSRINFERITKTGRAKAADVIPLNRDVDNWLFDAYLESKRTKIDVGLFQAIDEAVIHHQLIGCRLRRCQQIVTTVNPDGTIAGCPNTANQTFGTIWHENAALRQTCIAVEEKKATECYLCKYFKYCNGECFQLQFDESGCPGMKKVIQYVTDTTQHI